MLYICPAAKTCPLSSCPHKVLHNNPIEEDEENCTEVACYDAVDVVVYCTPVITTTPTDW